MWEQVSASEYSSLYEEGALYLMSHFPGIYKFGLFEKLEPVA